MRRLLRPTPNLLCQPQKNCSSVETSLVLARIRFAVRVPFSSTRTTTPRQQSLSSFPRSSWRNESLARINASCLQERNEIANSTHWFLRGLSILFFSTAIFMLQSESTSQADNNETKTADVTITANAKPMPSAARSRDKKKLRRPKVVESNVVCNPWISVFEKKNRLVYILGTRHGQPYSAQLAADLVRNVRPKAVFVELDYGRVVTDMFRFVPTLNKGSASSNSAGTPNPIIWLVPEVETLEQWNDANSTPPIPKFKEMALKPVSAEFGSIIQRMYHTIDNDTRQEPCEFIRAMLEGQSLGATIVLGDRDFDITQALEANANQQDDAVAVSGVRFVAISADEATTSSFLFSPLSSSTLPPREDVRRYNDRLLQVGPANFQARVAQRDAYMAAGIDSLQQFPTMVAIMGKSHVFGVEERLKAAGWKQCRLKCSK